MDNNYSKRILAFFLSIIMLVGILPINIFAADPETGNTGNPVPQNRKTKVNWDDKDSEVNWGLNQDYGLTPAQKLNFNCRAFRL